MNQHFTSKHPFPLIYIRDYNFLTQTHLNHNHVFLYLARQAWTAWEISSDLKISSSLGYLSESRQQQRGSKPITRSSLVTHRATWSSWTQSHSQVRRDLLVDSSRMLQNSPLPSAPTPQCWEWRRLSRQHQSQCNSVLPAASASSFGTEEAAKIGTEAGSLLLGFNLQKDS